MIFRQVKQEEIDQLFREGYKVWSKNRTFEQYCSDNGKEDAYGTRYVIEDNGEIVSSMILLTLKSIGGKSVYGIGSVLTSPIYQYKGCATELLKNCIQQINVNTSLVFLYSEIAPSFYERFNFKVLPSYLQKDAESICMVLCDDDSRQVLTDRGIELIPDHF
jgi:predicted N-acetyltransferase YhbS